MNRNCGKEPGCNGNDDYSDRELYRRAVRAPDLVGFRVTVRETDLMILADRDLSSEAGASVLRHRLALENHLRRHPEFGSSFAPVSPQAAEPRVVALMSRAAAAAGVGPMAAVAGAIAECVGEELRRASETVIVENGGDIFLVSPRERVVGIYAGRGPGEFRFGLRIGASRVPLGVATSSAVVGPSFSGGRARAATVLAASASLADAAATALGNRLRGPEDVKTGLAWLAGIPGVTGGVAIIGETLGAWGGVDLVKWDREAKP